MYTKYEHCISYLDRVKRIWYLKPMQAAKVQASLRIRAVSPEPPLFAHTSSESRGTFRQKARSLAPLNGWACVVKICYDGMLEDTNSLDGAHLWFACNGLKCQSECMPFSRCSRHLSRETIPTVAAVQDICHFCGVLKVQPTEDTQTMMHARSTISLVVRVISRSKNNFYDVIRLKTIESIFQKKWPRLV